MKVGGPAAEFYEPDYESGFVDCLNSLQNVFILGNGTNVIVRDGGYPGAVVSTLKALTGISIEGEKLVCGAGESLARVCRYAAEHSLTGLEELSGIPGTVGGAVFMNAGAYDSEIASVVVSVKAYDMHNENIIMLTNADCEFGYRTSTFKNKPLIILSAVLLLKPGAREEIEAKMANYTRKRNEKQPVDMPSAGSFFKRPDGDFAGRLIEAAGMKGARVGGAQVSEKHGGFIVNTGGATAADVLALSEEIKQKVFEMSGIMLEEEPVIIG